MNTGAKIGLIFLAVAVVGGAVTYYVYTELGKEPEIKVTGMNFDTRTMVITIGKKQINYKFVPNTVLYVGKVSPFYTAQIVAYTMERPDDIPRADIKLMKNGKLVKTKKILQ